MDGSAQGALRRAFCRGSDSTTESYVVCRDPTVAGEPIGFALSLVMMRSVPAVPTPWDIVGAAWVAGVPVSQACAPVLCRVPGLHLVDSYHVQHQDLNLGANPGTEEDSGTNIGGGGDNDGDGSFDCSVVTAWLIQDRWDTSSMFVGGGAVWQVLDTSSMLSFIC
jgi:hypothetical protein